MPTALRHQKRYLPPFKRDHSRLNLLEHTVPFNTRSGDYFHAPRRAERVLVRVVVPFRVRERVFRERRVIGEVWFQESVEEHRGVGDWDVLIVVW